MIFLVATNDFASQPPKCQPLVPKLGTNSQFVHRVKKTGEQWEHARGTPRYLPRNTQAPKQRMISPFFAGVEKRINEINMTGTRQTGVKQRLRNKHRQSIIMQICTIVISLCQILSFHYLFPGAKDTFLDFIEKKILFLVELNVKMFKILFLVELNRKCFLVQLYAKLLKKDFSTESKMIYTDSGMVPKGSGRVGLGS